MQGLTLLWREFCRRRDVFGSKQAAPMSVSCSTGCSLSNMAMRWVGGSGLASSKWLFSWIGSVWVPLFWIPTAYFINENRSTLSRAGLRIWMGSSTLFVFSAVSGLSSLGTSEGDVQLRFRRLSLFLPPGRFLALLVRTRIKSRPVGGSLGLPFL